MKIPFKVFKKLDFRLFSMNQTVAKQWVIYNPVSIVMPASILVFI